MLVTFLSIYKFIIFATSYFAGRTVGYKKYKYKKTQAYEKVIIRNTVIPKGITM